MDHFTYRRGKLYAEGVALTRIAREIGTPFYCYSTATLRRHYQVFAGAFASVPATVCYAVKANSNVAVIRTLAELGAGADVDSEGELRRALQAGVPASKIVFSGVGKRREEIAAALKARIGQFNIESDSELRMISELAVKMRRRAPIAVRINPDVDAHTHHKISTGRKHDKFGIGWPEARATYRRAAKLPGIDVVGVAVHIGSQITTTAPFRAAFRFIAGVVDTLRADGHDIRRLDLGGGLGVPYVNEDPVSPDAYARVAIAETKRLGVELMLEPGRLLVGNAGILVTEVIHEKQAGGLRMLVVDAGMNDLIRPAMYDAVHAIVPVAKRPGAAKPVDVVGPVCESSDIFVRDWKLAPTRTGDLLAIRTAGAYGAAMSSTYNSRLLVPEVLVKGTKFAVIRPRQSFASLLGEESLPPWLGHKAGLS